jgi:[acyl-carrier-protein] S-malonyltransferase
VPQSAFLFPGQGAQFVGMGRELCAKVPAARQLFDEARDVLGYDLADLCQNGPAERLNATDVSQPAIFVASLAALESLQASDPDAVNACGGTAGLSLGEYTALVFAGAMSFRDALRVVKRRGEAMQAAAEATPSGMVAVLMLERDKVDAICEQARSAGPVRVANLLCPGNIVVSGSLAACDAVEKLVPEAGGTAKRLTVAGAFHTDLMKPADEAVAAALADVEMRTPRIPVWTNVDAKPHTDPEEIRRGLVRQVVQPVLWEQTMRELLAAGFDRFCEIGPGRVLAGLLKRVQRKAECVNVAAD